MTKCPYCFTQLKPDLAAFACAGPCKHIPDEVYSNYRGTQQMTKPLSVVRRPEGRKAEIPSRTQCRQCSTVTEQEVCLTCHEPLPTDWRRGEATCVALAGARSTGKTNCLAVMVQELKHFIVAQNRPFNFVTSAANNSGDVYEKNLLTPLYAQRGILSATAAGVGKQLPPIILSLGAAHGVPRYLVLRDVAGEDLERADESTHLSFMARASLIVFLFDPTAVPNVRDLLRDLIPTHQVGGSPARVLEHVQRLKRGGQPRLAVTLAKLDTLWHIGDLAGGGRNRLGEVDVLISVMSNTGSSLRRALKPSEKALLGEDRMLVHHEVRSLLMLLHATELVQLVEHDADVAAYRYFALSALGHPPDASGLSVHGISPYRVLDPLLWVLSEEGAL